LSIYFYTEIPLPTGMLDFLDEEVEMLVDVGVV
jgi:hypothetical protein